MNNVHVYHMYTLSFMTLFRYVMLSLAVNVYGKTKITGNTLLEFM